MVIVRVWYTFMLNVFFFFLSLSLSSARMNSNITWIYCAGDKVHWSCTVHRSHDTIHTLKNYFTIVFSFQQNKLYPNEPIMHDFFFFFWVKHGNCFYSVKPSRSAWSTMWNCGGISSIKTKKSGMLMAYLAKLWAKVLQSLFVWE